MTRPAGRMKDIAQVLNLSAGTVSRALSGRGEIAQQTRDRVHEVAADLNYAHRGRLRKPSATSMSRIGVCVGNPCVASDGTHDPTFVGLHYLTQLERAASAAHVGVMVGFVDAMNAGPRTEALPMLQPGETQGVILVYPFPEPMVQRLAARTAVVSIEHVYPSASLDTIGPAHSVDAMSAVEHLYKLGHRRIAYVGDEDATGHKLTMGLRHAGYVSGLARCDLPYRPADVTNVYAPMVPKSELAARVAELVRDGVTAVVTSIDRHGYLLWGQLPALGIRVPEDLSLVGIGGIYRAAGLPQLTTWRCNYEAIATVAIEALKSRRSASRSGDLYQEITSVFVPGESSGPPRG